MDLAASPPWMMTVSSSSGPAGLALAPHGLPVLVWLGRCPTSTTRFWVVSLFTSRIFAILALTGHVGLTDFVLLLGDPSLVYLPQSPRSIAVAAAEHFFLPPTSLSLG